MILPILSLVCLTILAFIFLCIDSEQTEGAGVMKVILIALVAIPFGVIWGYTF